jgi:hypothetical protein
MKGSGRSIRSKLGTGNINDSRESREISDMKCDIRSQ